MEDFSLEQSFLSILSAMKNSFLPREENRLSVRQIVIALEEQYPLILLRKNEKSVLI